MGSEMCIRDRSITLVVSERLDEFVSPQDISRLNKVAKKDILNMCPSVFSLLGCCSMLQWAVYSVGA